jgi:hypothetical protein
VRGRAHSGRTPKLTDDRVSLLLDGRVPDGNASLAPLAAFVRSTRRLYVASPRPAVGERHEAMIAEAARQLPAAGRAPMLRSKPWRLGASLRSHPRRAVALAAAGVALGLAGAWAVTDTGRESAPTISDRSGTAPVPERVTSAELPSPRPRAERTRPSAPDPPAGSPRASAPRAAPPVPAPQHETAPPLEPQPDALAVRPQPELEPPGESELVPPGESESPPYRGYGGPDSRPTPLKGQLDTEPPVSGPLEGQLDTEPPIPAPDEESLDTEPPIPAPLEGPLDTEPPIQAPPEGAPAP